MKKIILNIHPNMIILKSKYGNIFFAIENHIINL